MEAATENRRGRGRPRVFSEEELGSSGLSRRQKQNRVYAERGRTRLRSYWGEEREVPLCVLSEFGRIHDDTKFREAACWHDFSAQGLTAKQTAAKIKEIRTGTTPQEGPATLFERLGRTIEDFRVDYPDASLQYVEGQMELALQIVRYFQRCAP